MQPNCAWTYLQLPLRQWGAGNVYLFVLSSWKVNIAHCRNGVVDTFRQKVRRIKKCQESLYNGENEKDGLNWFETYSSRLTD